MISIFNSCIEIKPRAKKITLTEKKLKKYFPPDYSNEEIEQVIESLVKSIVTDEKGVAKTGNKDLPYGDYTIKEVKTNASYLLTDGKPKPFRIREDGKIVELSEAFKGEVVRGDVEIEKLDRETDVRVPLGSATHVGTTFEITNRSVHPVVVDGKLFQVGEVCKTIKIEKETAKTTGEKHIIVTDENGQFNSENSWYAHSSNTNANDAAVGTDGKVDETKLTPEAGIWFDTDREGNRAKKVDDSLGAMPYDTYVMDELACKANEGAKLVKNREFTIWVDKRNISLGTIDDPSDKQIGTVAADGLTKDHFGSNASESIIDTVSFKGLTKGQKYTMKGTLIDKESGQALLIEGKEIIAEAVFTPDERNGEAELVFEFPAGALAGKSVVAFETCYQEDVEVAVHTDIEDENQTVHYPKIGTVMTDNQTKDHVAAAGEMFTLIDTVAYQNFEPGRKYTMQGKIMDQATGKAFLENGKEVTLYGVVCEAV